MTTAAFVYDAVRTPFGRFGGLLAGTRPDDLAAHVLRQIVTRAPGLAEGRFGERVDEVVLGNANGAGEENRNVAPDGRAARRPADERPRHHRQPALRLEPRRGDDRLAARSRPATPTSSSAGGVESMTRAPWVLPKTERALSRRQTSPRSPRRSAGGWSTRPCRRSGRSRSARPTSSCAEKYGVSRERQDEFAARSHRLADRGLGRRLLRRPRRPRPGHRPRPRRGHPSRHARAEKLAGLKPSFRTEGGTITAGNASPLNDGASAVLLGSEGAPRRARPRPARPRSPAAARSAARAPALRLRARSRRPTRRSARAGIGWDDVGAVELNEAFAAQSLACIDAWADRPRDRQPARRRHRHRPPARAPRAAASSARSPAASSAAGERWGVAAICIGVGQGLAVVLENVSAGATS